MLYKTTGIENSSLENSEVKLFPNPASRDLYVVGTAGSNYEVVNVEGRVLQRGILSSKAIDISVLPAGFYTLRLMSTMKGLQTLKFTKQ
jgi:hypothetical protein